MKGSCVINEKNNKEKKKVPYRYVCICMCIEGGIHMCYPAEFIIFLFYFYLLSYFLECHYVFLLNLLYFFLSYFYSLSSLLEFLSDRPFVLFLVSGRHRSVIRLVYICLSCGSRYIPEDT